MNQSLGTKLGLWTYTSTQHTHFFGICVWLVAGLAAYGVASKAVVRQTLWIDDYFPRLFAPVLVIALFLIVWLFRPSLLEESASLTAPTTQTLFWLLFALLMLIGTLAAVRSGAGAILGIIISAWIVGFISEASGATAGIWYFPHLVMQAPVDQAGTATELSRACPPIYLIFGCWPLEIVAQFAPSALIAWEPLVPSEKGKDRNNGGGEAQGGTLTPPSFGTPSTQGEDAAGAQPSSPNNLGCQGSGTTQALGKTDLPDRLCQEENPLVDLTDGEKELKIFMLLSAFVYLGVGFLFVLWPGLVVYALQDWSRFLAAPLSFPEPDDKFWVTMTFSMMMCISFLAFYAQYDIRKNKNYVVALMVAKSASAISALLYFIFHRKYQPYLAIFAVDGTLFWLTLHFYIRANMAFLKAQTAYFRQDLGSLPSMGSVPVAVCEGSRTGTLDQAQENEEKKQLLDRVLDRTEFDEILETHCQRSGKPKDEFSVVIKPNFMFAHWKDDPSTYTDPLLVEHLVERIRSLKFTAISIVESQTTLENYYENRTVEEMAKCLGYTGKGYAIVNLSKESERVCHSYGGRLGYHYVGRTWRDADFSISFAKNKTHVFSNYTLTLKNIYGTLPQQNKLRAYHTKREYDWPVIDTLRPENCPVHYGLIDAYVSADGQFGVVTDPHPNKTKTIIGGANLMAVDSVGAKKMGLDPEDPSVGRFYYLAAKEFGKCDADPQGDPGRDPLSIYEPWENVSQIYIKALDIIEEAYHFSNWGFSILSNQKHFAFTRQASTTVRFLRWLLKPIKRKYYGY